MPGAVDPQHGRLEAGPASFSGRKTCHVSGAVNAALTLERRWTCPARGSGDHQNSERSVNFRSRILPRGKVRDEGLRVRAAAQDTQA